MDILSLARVSTPTWCKHASPNIPWNFIIYLRSGCDTRSKRRLYPPGIVPTCGRVINAILSEVVLHYHNLFHSPAISRSNPGRLSHLKQFHPWASSGKSDKSISPYGEPRATVKETPLNAEELRKMDAYFHPSLYLCLGMLYLQHNSLLREPLKVDHLKPRLLGHWGSDAGQVFTYLHFNRLIKKYNLDAIFISGPGHGAPPSFRRLILRAHTLKSIRR